MGLGGLRTSLSNRLLKAATSVFTAMGTKLFFATLNSQSDCIFYQIANSILRWPGLGLGVSRLPCREFKYAVHVLRVCFVRATLC